MFRWDRDNEIENISPRDLTNPIYGFFYDKKSTNRNLSVADSEGISQFQVSLIDHKNETNNVEYNPLDVFLNAKRLSSNKNQPQPIQQKHPNPKSGYNLYMREVRPNIQERNPDVSFGATTKMVARSWNELTPAEQEQYNIRAQNMPDIPDDYHNDIEQQNEFYGIRQPTNSMNSENQGHSIYDIHSFQN